MDTIGHHAIFTRHYQGITAIVLLTCCTAANIPTDGEVNYLYNTLMFLSTLFAFVVACQVAEDYIVQSPVVLTYVSELHSKVLKNFSTLPAMSP